MRALALLLLALGSSSALAAPPAAVLPLQASGADAGRAGAGLREALSRALGTRGHEPLAVAEVDRRLLASDPTCVSSSCRAELSGLLQAALLLGGRLARQAGDGGTVWTVDLWLYDGERRATVAVLRDRCGACDEAQLLATAPRLVGELLDQARGSAGGATLAVGSSPSGASVTVDGTPVGITPLSYGVSPGRHTVTVQLAGHRLSAHEVSAEAGGTVRVEALLEPDGTAPAAAGGGPFSPRVLRWVTLGLAVAGLASGIPLLVIHGRDTCERQFGECPQQHNTLAAGVTLTAVGALSAGASALLFYFHARSQPAEEASLTPRLEIGAASISARWRF